MGGAVVLEYALDFPGSLSGLVVVGSAAGAPDQMRAALDSQQMFVESHDMRAIAESRMTAAFGTGADSGTRRWMVEMIAANDVGSYRSQAAAAFAFDVRDRLGDLAAPAAILHGSDDRVLPVALAHDLLGRISDSSLQVLDGLGHFANLEDPDRFNAMLLSAVSGLHRCG